MIDIVRNLSRRAEFCVVVLVGFGYFLWANALYVLYPSVEPALTNAGLQELVAIELLVSSVLAAFLYVRGWRLARVGAPFAVSDLFVAVGLVVVAYLFLVLDAFVGAAIDSTAGDPVVSANLVRSDIRIPSLVAVSIVNPFFEEALLCGYVVTALRERRGLWFAVSASVGLRLACHVYQGPAALVSIVPTGFWLTYWYARTRRIWPVILAHAAIDAAGLWPYLMHDVV